MHGYLFISMTQIHTHSLNVLCPSISMTHTHFVCVVSCSFFTHTHTHTQNFVSKKEKPLNGKKKRILTSCCDDVQNMWHAHMGVATSTCFLQCHIMLQECYISPPRTGCLKMRCRSS
jgi:hypothetical protein